VTVSYYVRVYKPRAPHTNKGYQECILNSDDVFFLIKYHWKYDVVNMATGTVARHDYKRPLPGWLSEPLIRAAVEASKIIPNGNP
jgi:hypothetical protein